MAVLPARDVLSFSFFAFAAVGRTLGAVTTAV
jgi:hypothetical protein